MQQHLITGDFPGGDSYGKLVTRGAFYLKYTLRCASSLSSLVSTVLEKRTIRIRLKRKR